MATHSSVLAWRIPGTGSLVGCRLWGRTESDTTEATQQQQQQHCFSHCSPLSRTQDELIHSGPFHLEMTGSYPCFAHHASQKLSIPALPFWIQICPALTEQGYVFLSQLQRCQRRTQKFLCHKQRAWLGFKGCSFLNSVFIEALCQLPQASLLISWHGREKALQMWFLSSRFSVVVRKTVVAIASTSKTFAVMKKFRKLSCFLMKVGNRKIQSLRVI